MLTDFLQKFITEINILQTNGFNIDNKNYKVKIKCFIYDTPARSFIKSIVSHTGFSCCERCTAIGKKVNRVTVISSIDSPERTDETFRSFLDPHHHKNATPLLLIDPPINMVHCFLLDFMHLGCLGMMKRLLEY